MINKKKQGFFGTEHFVADIREKLLNTKLIWLWVAFIAFAALIICFSALADMTKSYEEGDIAAKSLIYEGSTVTFTSQVAYDKEVAKIESGVNDVYLLDESCLENIRADIDAFLETCEKAQSAKGAKAGNELYKELLGDGDAASTFAESLKKLSYDEIAEAAASLRSWFSQNYAQGVKDDDMESFREQLSTYIGDSDLNSHQKTAVRAIVSTLEIVPNYILDEEETAAVKENRIAAIEPQKVTIRSGEKIVDEGTEITADQIEMLQKAGMLTERRSLFYYVGILTFVLGIFLLLFMFFKRFYPYYAFEKKGILLVGSIFCGFLLLCQIIMMVASTTTGIFYSILGYVIPLPALALLFTTLTNQRVAFISTVSAALLMSMMVLAQPVFLIVALCSSLFTVYTVGRIRDRYQFVSFGFYLGLVNVAVIIVCGLVGEQSLKTMGAGCIVGLLSGFVSSFLALGTIPMLENYMSMATPMKLMELSSTGHPLMKRLINEAPGTYYHSILVANLAEAGAAAIGADALLVRVGAYYHDIGKLERPAYFTENQEPGNNPHDKLTPTLSVLVITSHVKDGTELARSYGLPDEVIDIIEQHHGDDLIKFFYAKALEQDPEAVPGDFSYPFPKPQSREAALVMMADSVQAALQSMDRPGRRELAAKIHEIIEDRLNNGQFRESNLTFRDLHIIQDAFVNVYEGMMHHRIKYPDLKKLAKKGGMESQVPSEGSEIFDANHNSVGKTEKEQ